MLGDLLSFLFPENQDNHIIALKKMINDEDNNQDKIMQTFASKRDDERYFKIHDVLQKLKMTDKIENNFTSIKLKIPKIEEEKEET